jgi:predicted transcriptional regulator
MTEILQKALQEVEAQIARKTEQRNQLDIEIVQLQATKIGLQNALGQQVQAETAWTELVLAALKSYPAGQQVTASEIRDRLQSWGYSFEGVENPLALINTVLRRLVERAVIVRSKSGRPFRFARFGKE